MAFQTSVMVDGIWTTRTMDTEAALRHYNQKDKEAEARALNIDAPPIRGLLTQTVIQSPLVHWILPAHYRSKDNNDVAFIGNDFIQIKELREGDVDGHLGDIARKEGFGARIRNARVIGFRGVYPTGQRSWYMEDERKEEDAMDVDRMEVPPKSIILQLESGDLVLLMLTQSENEIEFITGRHRLSRSMLGLEPGTHLTVDPSGRYMAVGCSESIFAIYELSSRAALSQQCSRRNNVRFVESERHIYITGAILHMEFLFPSHADEYHIILLVIVVSKGKTRMLIYEWEAGNDLKAIRPHSDRGYALSEAHRMPLLLIPVKIEAAFILVFETSMAGFRGILHGPPIIEEFSTLHNGPTENYHGLGKPLWTAWSRPARHSDHVAQDDILIAREDGLIKFLEIDTEDFIKGDMNVAQFESCNVGTALASLDYKKTGLGLSGDLLISGGGAGPGETLLLLPRQKGRPLERIQNWSPALDFAIVSQKEADPRPQRLFACSGKGHQSAITELKYGLEAKLGLECSYNAPITQAWVVSPKAISSHADTLLLLSLPNCSALLKLSSDAKEISEVSQDSTGFDLENRTIAASVYGDFAVQVTEQSIVITDKVEVRGGEDLLRPGQRIIHAVICEDAVVFTTHSERSCSKVQVLEIVRAPSGSDSTSSGPRFYTTVRSIRHFDTEITCITMCSIGQRRFAIVAEEAEDSRSPPNLFLLPLHDDHGHLAGKLHMRTPRPSDEWTPGSIVSMVGVGVSAPSDRTLLFCGSRNGFVITTELFMLDGLLANRLIGHDHFGATSAVLTLDDISGSQIFVNCDSKVYALSTRVSMATVGLLSSSRRINRIWITETRNPALSQPEINSVARLGPNLSAGTEGGLLAIAGSEILLLGLGLQPKAVPRQLALRGTPSRLIYSHTLDAFIVTATVKGMSTLLFVDPSTGYDISDPIDHNGMGVKHVSGLGNMNESMLDLFEWFYTKDGKTWHFIIVCTDSGKLLFYSAEKATRSSTRGLPIEEQTDHSPSRGVIQYWLRHKEKLTHPLCSAIGCKHGIVYSSGNWLYCDTLDLTERKFRTVAVYELPSAAISLSRKGEEIYVLTMAHSLEIFSLVQAKEGTFSFQLTHSDQVSRAGLHFKIAEKANAEDSIHLLSDKLRSVAGIRASTGTKSDTLNTVVEAQLPHSILRFRSGFTRPIWQSGVPFRELDIIDTTGHSADILGLALDGSLCHFTILGPRSWRFLKFLSNLAQQSPKICEFTHDHVSLPLEPALEPKAMMHVDGDVLRRCLEKESLEDLLCIGQDTERAREIHEKFLEVFLDLHQKWPRDKDGVLRNSVDQAYIFLEFYLRPVV